MIQVLGQQVTNKTLRDLMMDSYVEYKSVVIAENVTTLILTPKNWIKQTAIPMGKFYQVKIKGNGRVIYDRAFPDVDPDTTSVAVAEITEQRFIIDLPEAAEASGWQLNVDFEDQDIEVTTFINEGSSV